MKIEKTSQPNATYRVWVSTKDIIEFADWLPEVVGHRGELLRIGSIPIRLEAKLEATDLPTAPLLPTPLPEPGLRFIDADVTKYRKLLFFFRKRHPNSAKKKQ